MPTVLGTCMMFPAFYWIATGAIAGGRGLVLVVGGAIFLLLAIVLLRMGRGR